MAQNTKTHCVFHSVFHISLKLRPNKKKINNKKKKIMITSDMGSDPYPKTPEIEIISGPKVPINYRTFYAVLVGSTNTVSKSPRQVVLLK